MFRLVALSALFAIAAAAPGLIAQTHVLAPAAISHQSVSQVHTRGHIVSPLVRTVALAPVVPVVKSYVVRPVVPVVKTIIPVAPVVKTVVPVTHSVVPVLKTVHATPYVKTAVLAAPAVHYIRH